VHLGGSLGADAGFGRKLRGLKVTADGLADYVEQLLRSYQADRAADETFAGWVRRAAPELLARAESTATGSAAIGSTTPGSAA
jgi:sulfite reductase (ferredoxin)